MPQRKIFHTKDTCFVLAHKISANRQKKNKAKDSLICEKIIGSIDSKEMIKRLLRDSELTLNKAANMVRVFEISRIQVSGQKGKTAADSILKSKV